MAVKVLDSITTLSDLLDYVQAEYNDAVSYCSSAVPNYQSVLSQVKSYNDADQAGMYDASTREEKFNSVLYALSSARTAWKSAGCKSGSSTASTDTTVTDVIGSRPSIITWLVVGGLGFLAYYLYTQRKK